MDSLTDEFEPAIAAAVGLMNRYLEVPSTMLAGSFGDPLISDLSNLAVVLLSVQDLLQPAAHAIGQDPQLQDLLRTRNGQQPFMNELAGGSRLDTNPREFALQLLVAATKWEYVLRRPITSAGFRSRLDEDLTYLRAGLGGQEIPTLRIVGFAGLPLETDSIVQTVWGKVIPTPKPSLSAMIAAASSGPGAVGASALLLLERTYQPQVSWEAMPPLLLPELSADRIFMLVSLAFLLATERKQRVGPTVLWTIALPRFIGLSFGSVRYQFGPIWSTRADPLTADELDAVARWSAVLESQHNPNIDLAVRRCLSSGALRLDPADRLMDAVIAWENLFGASPETSFRLAAAISKLLTTVADERRALLKRLLELYRRRSEVAHGANLQSAQEDADEALDIAVRCLRKLYQDRTDLLSLAKSIERANDLLLIDSPNSASLGIAVDGA